MFEPSLLSLCPALLAIFLAIATRQVLLALFGGIWLGYCILLHINPLHGLAVGLDGIINVFKDAGDTKVIIFTLVVGGLIASMEYSGGVKGFVLWLEQRQWANSTRGAQLLAWMIGIVIFIESNLTLLVAGAVSRPLFDRLKISREKLAYIIDSTSAPICILIPFNAWGAFNIGLISSTGEVDSFQLFLQAIPLNLYPISAVLLAGVSIWMKRDIGPMREAEKRTQQGLLLWPNSKPVVDPALLVVKPDNQLIPNASYMLLPVIAMVVALPVGLLITGNGDIASGSGSTSVLWSVFFALIVLWCLCLARGSHNVDQLVNFFLKGAGGLVPVAIILLLSMALGDVTSQLQAGQYIAGVVKDTFSAPLLLPLIFLVSSAIAFSVGTSWGTFAIMIPIALPIAESLGIPQAPFLAAVLSGAIFGDHASPISDTTVVASMAAATDHIDHVRTQLPYALLAGFFSLVGFVVIGLMM